MANAQFTIDNDDLTSTIYSLDANYFTAHDASTGTIHSHAFIRIGQYFSASLYYVHRGYFCFDTSGLDDNALIISATLTLSGNANNSMIGEVILKSGQPTYPHVPQVVGDYLYTQYDGDGGSCTPDGGGSCVFTLNYTGRSWINKTGYTKFIVVTENDNNRIFVGPNNEDIEVDGNYDTEPVLDVTYTIPTNTPVVGDPTFSSTKGTYTKATANVSDDGDGYEERGFEYGLTEEPTWATRQTGIFTGTGDFTQVISGLIPLTTYYARAYVTNSYGTDYSEWTSFTTTDVPAYGLYEEDNTATICFYISEDDGMTWGQKHGPYTTDQADIEITKLLVRGSGKKKIKFESDVLTGISASVMVKLDLKAR